MSDRMSGLSETIGRLIDVHYGTHFVVVAMKSVRVGRNREEAAVNASMGVVAVHPFVFASVVPFGGTRESDWAPLRTSDIPEDELRSNQLHTHLEWRGIEVNISDEIQLSIASE